MQRELATWMGLGILLAGCGSAPPTGIGDERPARGNDGAPPLSVERVAASQLAPKGETEATGSLVIAFRNPRTSFSSDKIELSTGKTLDPDDGMSPEGDLSFFFDGSRFQIIANAAGGANRNLAPAKAGKPTGAFSMGPIPLQEGTEVLLKQDHGLYSVTITGLQPGSMRFLPSGSGTGTGSVSFSYRARAINPI